jgi:thymidylate kinase
LRQGNPNQLNAREIQIIYSLNRYQFQEELIKKLEQGINIVAEDYTGTGIAWGVGRGVDQDFLIRINQHLLPPDKEILLDGERFLEGKEKYHINENDDELVNRVRKIHLDLQTKYHWPIVEANHSREEVAEQIWQLVKVLF